MGLERALLGLDGLDDHEDSDATIAAIMLRGKMVSMVLKGSSSLLYPSSVAHQSLLNSHSFGQSFIRACTFKTSI